MFKWFKSKDPFICGEKVTRKKENKAPKKQVQKPVKSEPVPAPYIIRPLCSQNYVATYRRSGAYSMQRGYNTDTRYYNTRKKRGKHRR